MRKISSLRGRIMSDCAAAMLLPAAVYAAGDLLGGILTVYTAGILGSFADAVLRMNVDGGMRSFLQMLVCLAVNIVVVPLIGVFGEVLLFTRSLKHERYCVGSFLDKSYRSASEMGAGEVQYSIEDDPIDMRCNFVDLAENVVIIPVIFAYLVYRSVGISPLFTVITAAVSALKLTVPVVTRKAMAKFDRADKEYQAELREYETEMTERPHIVRLYGLKKAIIERFDRLYLGYFRRAVRRSSRYRTIAGSILSAADPLCTLTVLFVGVLLASRGHITIGSVAAMVGYLGVYSMLFSKVGSFIRTLPLLRVNIDRVEKLYLDGERRGGEQVADDALIRVDGLSFRYVDKPVLDNVTFSVEKGDKLAVTGANGSGKSTLIMLLCGLFEGYDGSIEVGGHELRETDLKAWRRCFAFVQQDPYLFDGSVLENVRIGDLSADDARVKAVMEQLGILYLADRDATRSEKVLSGGERQRISLARALLKGTDLLIFDEPGNNLDPTALAWMADYIKNCDKTVIVVTHDELLQQAANKTLRLA